MENENLKQNSPEETKTSAVKQKNIPGLKKAISAESFITIGIFIVVFGSIAHIMGGVNMMNTLMQTAYSLLLETVFYIMGIAVIAGAFSGLMSEFGIISLINKALSPLMKPLYDLPGASTLGILSCYMSDNPAILTLAGDEGFKRYFKKYQLPALTNIGTSFGMGLIITTFMIGITPGDGESFGLAVLIGNIGAIIGSIISTRLMLHQTKKIYGTEAQCIENADGEALSMEYRKVREGSTFARFLQSILDGGKVGVEMGMAIIPGVLIICTIVLMLTNGPSEAGVYTGAAYEGIGLLPWIGEKLGFILKPLFNFSCAEAISVPITSLGAAGAAIGLVPKMVSQGLVHAHDIAVFTAMCMCWSGYLSTHVAMMDSLKCPHLATKAIVCHTIGGISAGVAANLLFQLASMVF